MSAIVYKAYATNNLLPIYIGNYIALLCLARDHTRQALGHKPPDRSSRDIYRNSQDLRQSATYGEPYDLLKSNDRVLKAYL